MKRNVITALVLSLMLSGCSTYEAPGGRTQFGDPVVCGGSTSVCAFLVAALMAGCVAAAASTQ